MVFKRFMRFVLATAGGLLGLVLVLPALALWLVLWFVSWLVRLTTARARVSELEATPWPELLEFDGEVGWRNRARLDTYAVAADGSVFRITTDDDGWRGKTRLEECDVVVVGDSFAYGQAASDSAYFGSQADGLKVKAIGANGYSMVHGTLLMEALAPRMAGKLVVWMIFYGNDLHDNLRAYQERYRQPFVRQGRGGWELVTDHLTPQPWPFHSARRDHRDLANICSDTFLSRRAFSASEFLLDRAQAAVETIDARLVVVGIPEKWLLTRKGVARLKRRSTRPETFDPRAIDSRLGSICESRGIHFVPLARHLSISDYLPRDSHWNPVGHRKVGLLLSELFRRHDQSSTGSADAGHTAGARG